MLRLVSSITTLFDYGVIHNYYHKRNIKAGATLQDYTCFKNGSATGLSYGVILDDHSLSDDLFLLICIFNTYSDKVNSAQKK